MTIRYGTFVPPKFDQKELDARITNASGFYDKYIFIETFTFAEALSLYDEYKKSGHTLDDTFLPVSRAIDPAGFNQAFQIRMIKPQKQQKSDLEMIAREETEKYQVWLKQEEARAVDLMTTRLIEEEKERRAKAAESEAEVIREAARIEAANILGVSLQEAV